MEPWREELYEYELWHHGIKGMKWGVRKYQNPDGSYTEAGKRRYGIGEGSNNLAVRNAEKKSNYIKRKAADTYVDSLIKDYGKDSSIKVTAQDSQGVTRTVKYTLNDPASVRAYKNRLVSDATKDENRLFSEKNDRYALSRDDVRSINPMFSSNDSSYRVNCQRCAVALELKKRGMDPQAAKNTNTGSSSSVWGIGSYSARNALAYNAETTMFKNAKPVSVGNKPEDLFKHFEKYGQPGMTGTLSYTGNGYGHVLNYTVLEDGTVRIEDGQNSKVETLEEFLKRTKDGKNFTVTRLDDCDPNYKVIEMGGVIANKHTANLPNRSEQAQKNRNDRIGSKQNLTAYNFNTKSAYNFNTQYRIMAKRDELAKKRNKQRTAGIKNQRGYGGHRGGY